MRNGIVDLKEISRILGETWILRLLVPALVTPSNYGVQVKNENMCIAIAQILRNISSKIHFGLLQPHLTDLNELVDRHISKMSDFLLKVGVKIISVVYTKGSRIHQPSH